MRMTLGITHLLDNSHYVMNRENDQYRDPTELLISGFVARLKQRYDIVSTDGAASIGNYIYEHELFRGDAFF